VKVLGIGGSPRTGGNTDILLDRVLESARKKGAQTEKLVLNELDFCPCQECEKMRDDGTCKIEDDMRLVYAGIDESDAVVLASPIFFGSLSAQTKMMIDRFQCMWRAKFIVETVPRVSEKKGAFIAVEASRKESFLKNGSSIVKNFFATAGIIYQEELFCTGTDRKGAIHERDDCLKTAEEIGRRITTKN